MKVSWTPEAQAELRTISAYYFDFDPAVARKILGRILRASAKLVDHPSLGRKGRIRGTRELIAHGTPYVLAFSQTDGLILIRTVRHGARRWPRRV